jgi:multidrug efflux pump subunit AcrB
VKGLVSWFTTNPVAANLLMVFLVVGGMVSLSSIKQEIFPEISADMVSVGVVYPGASPEEIEESICVPIEEEVHTVEGVKKVTSVATESAGAVTIEVRAGEDARRVLDDVKTRVDAIDSFPEEAEKPIIQEVTLRRQVLDVAVSGPADERTLRRLGEQVRDEIAELPGITQVEMYAVRPYEVSIEVSEPALQRFGLTFSDVADAVRRSSLDVPGGSVRTDGGEILLRTEGRAYRGPEFERVPLLTLPDGTRLTVGDVANVDDGFAETDQSARFDGDPAVLIKVYRTGDQSALELGRLVRGYVDEAGAHLPEGITLTVWLDNSRFLKERLDTLLRNGRSGLFLVFLLLALFLRFRLAFWVTIGIPISFLGTLMVMPMTDTSVNMLSLFAFILVLGIVVDDAIVVGENIFRKQREGLKDTDAAITGAREVAVPVTYAVLTTVAAFSPMMMLPGMTGRIWRIIPMVVIPALLFSLVESKLILPAHLRHSPSERKPRAWAGLWARFQGTFADGLEAFSVRLYRPALRFALEWRWLTAGTAVAALALTGGLVFGGFVKLSFFPPVEGDNVVALITMPQGTPAAVTERAVRRIEAAAEELRAELDGNIQHTLASIGEQPYRVDQSRNGGGSAESFSGAHLGEVNLELISPDDRTVPAEEIERLWRERTGPIPDAVELVFTSALFSAGEAINVQLSGRDIDELRLAADELKARLGEYPGTYNITDSFRAGKQELVLGIEPGAEALGLSLSDLGRQVRQGFYGEEAQRIQRGRDEVKVMVRYPADQRRSLGDVESMRIRTPAGDEVPFSSVATAELGRGFASINRTDRRRTINITAEVDLSVANANEIATSLSEETLPKLLATHRGLTWRFEGEQMEQQDTLASLGKGFLLALLAIYALMAIPFKSYVQPLIVMSAIPFGVIGAVIGHILLDIELSVLSMCGMVALAGVVVNDSLVLVDYVNRGVARGESWLEAVNEAGVARFRPILLTSLTTFAGLLPLLLERSVQAAFLIPMAASLAFGVMFSTLVTLVLVPAGLLMMGDLQRTGRAIWGRTAPLLGLEFGERLPRSTPR